MTVAESTVVQRLGLDQSVSWNPFARPQLERDTIFLLDPDFEQTLALADGQLPPGGYFDIPTDSGVPAPVLGDPASPIEIVDGVYRKGLRSPGPSISADLATIAGQFQLPVELPVDQFHIEMALMSEGATLSGTPVRVLGLPDFMFGWGVSWNAPGAFANYALPAGSRPTAGTWARVACGLDPSDSTLNFWFNGVRLFRQVVESPQESQSSFLKLFWLFDTTNRYRISDLKLSANYREPRESITVHGKPKIVVDPDTLTGKTTNKDLLGAVKGLGNAYTIATAAGKLTVTRIDKLLSATPIKAGGTDATHPVLGHSGNWSYDPQVIYRAADYAVTTLGGKIYFSADSTPSVLGGASGPFTGSDLTSALTNDAPFNKARPSNLTSMAEIVGDILRLILARHPGSVEYVGVWNEPGQEGFLTGSSEADRRTYYCQSLYPPIAAAVKAVDASIKVGGPELAGWDTTWADALVSWCAAHAVPLDFISWHWYQSNIWLIRQARRELDAIAATYSFTPPEFVIGEWLQIGVQLMRSPPFSGAEKNGVLDLLHGAYGAAWLARALMEMVRADVAIACTYVPEDTVDPGYTPRGTLLTSSHKWAALNVHEQWLMLAEDVVETTIENGPMHLDAMASVDGDLIDVLIANQDYRNYVNHHVTLQVPVADGTPATVFVVDDEHSSWLDVGAAHQDLESYDAGTFEDGELALTLRSRTSALVRIG